MIPLVDDVDRDWRNGWCTYTDGFENNPDVEYLCGGENDKTPTAAAIWRQGNLLHFGFEQSPSEMNRTGNHLLLNCIAYISRFTEDRPIAVTPSVFAGPVAYPRTYLDRRLGREGDVSESAWFLGPETTAELNQLSPVEVKRWFAENRSYLHPGEDIKLEIDADAKALGIPIDSVELFERTIPLLSNRDEAAGTAARLLERYGPSDGPRQADRDLWDAWFTEHRNYIFFSDQGDYRWYVDPLAKDRRVPTSELRGPARATVSD